MEIRDGDVAVPIMKNGQAYYVTNVIQQIITKHSTNVQVRVKHPLHICMLVPNVILFVYLIPIHKINYVKKYLLVVVVVMRVTVMGHVLEQVNVNVMMVGIPVLVENNVQ